MGRNGTAAVWACRAAGWIGESGPGEPGGTKSQRVRGRAVVVDFWNGGGYRGGRDCSVVWKQHEKSPQICCEFHNQRGVNGTNEGRRDRSVHGQTKTSRSAGAANVTAHEHSGTRSVAEAEPVSFPPAAERAGAAFGALRQRLSPGSGDV